MEVSRTSVVHKVVLVLPLLVLLAVHSNVSAAVVSFASRATFDAAFPGAVRENWDGFASGTVFTDGTGTNGIIYNSSAGNALVTSSFLNTTNPNSLGDTTVGFFQAADSVTFTFVGAVRAFGIDINTFATNNEAYTATTDLGNVIGSFFNPFPGFGTGQFVGFSSDSNFSSVTIAAAAGTTQSYTLDTLRAVAAIPEPATTALLALGLLGIGGFARRIVAT